MGINYRRHRRAVERLYEDVCTVERFVPIYNAFKGEDELILSEVYTEQKCKVSQIQLGRDGQTESQNNISYNLKLFIAPEIAIKQGDRVHVTRKATGLVESYSAGEPFPPYQSHQELILNRKDWA